MLYYNIILCGGTGKRLWPLSSEECPKQFTEILSNNTLLENTINRFNDCSNVIFSTNIIHKELFPKRYENIKKIYEPLTKNTAPAILLSCIYLKKKHINEKITVRVFPSDQILSDDFFNKCMEEVSLDGIILFGVTPNKINTNYGYIEHFNGTLKHFHEKPTADKCKEYIEKGYLFNSGIFMFDLDYILDCYVKLCPDMFNTLWENTLFDREICIDSVIYNKLDNISFDNAIVEKIDPNKCTVIPISCEWNDIGLWENIYDISQKTDQGNCIINASTGIINSLNNLVITKKQVLLIDVHDLIIVENDNKILISKMGSSSKVKELI